VLRTEGEAPILTVQRAFSWPETWSPWLRRHAFLLVALGIWLLPPLVAVAGRHWGTEQGAQGPIILATGCWAALYQARQSRAQARPGSLLWAAGWLALAGALYIAARMIGAASVELLAAYLGAIAVLYAQVGATLLRRIAAPLLYLAFVIPPPFTLVFALTEWLKPLIARSSVDLLFALGLEVAQSGNALFVDGYELLVETACSGLNSLVSLGAIGCFFIYWSGRFEPRDRRATIALALLLAPIAIAANLVRVSLLLWLVHLRGDAVLRSSWHPAAGLGMFAVALGLLLLSDRVLRHVRWRRPT
jgi:exosortase